MTSLLSSLSDLVCEAFAACGYPREGGAVRLSDRPDLAQFQCNGAMAAAKSMGKNPREVAQKIAEKLSAQTDLFLKIEVAGPGFLNLTLTDAALSRAMGAQSTDPHHGIDQVGHHACVVLDYGGPNAAKGDACRAFAIRDYRRYVAPHLIACGYHAIGDIHLGDDGLQAGMVISELEIRYPDWPYFDPGRTDGFPDTFPLDFDTLTEIYPAAAADAKADPARKDRARAATATLQKGHAGYKALWKNIIAMSTSAMRKNFNDLNVHFDLWKGENSVAPLIPPMVSDFRAKGFAIESEGALVVPVARNDDKKEFPPLILIKSDGAYLYATTDLATLIDRMKTTDHPHPSRCIYIVDGRQSLHFEQVFRAARMARIVPNTMQLDFAGFGTMNGTDGKPFKTRAGGVLRLQDLIAGGVDKARVRMAESHVGEGLSQADQDKIAHMVGVAAIKFADLKNPRHVDYIFDLDAMTNFEGKTGPYLLYQAVRIRSILARAAVAGIKPGATNIDDGSRALALLLLDYPNIIAMAATHLTPHVLADYLHRLAQEFAVFYNACHILSETDTGRQGAWLAVCQGTLDILIHGLGLMGINVPEKM